MGIASSGIDLENTFFDGEEGHIENSSSKIKDEDILVTDNLFVESVSDDTSGGFVDDTRSWGSWRLGP